MINKPNQSFYRRENWVIILHVGGVIQSCLPDMQSAGIITNNTPSHPLQILLGLSWTINFYVDLNVVERRVGVRWNVLDVWTAL